MKHLFKKIPRLLLLVTTLWLPASTSSAAIVTEIVDFTTPDDGELNLLGLSGTLNTLAQGLGAVDCGTIGTSVQGYMRAAVTFETFNEQPAQLLSVNFLGSSLQQEDIELFYDVPSTTRRVSFSTSGLSFAMNIGQGEDNNSSPVPSPITSNLTTAAEFSALFFNPARFQMVQNGGTAKVEITNRQPAVQNLLADPATSIYGLPVPDPNLERGSLTLYPPNQFTELYEMVLDLPLNYQKVVYTGTGLPVTLNYTGSLTLYSELPQLTVFVPEPSALMLSCLGVASMLTRRLKRTG